MNSATLERAILAFCRPAGLPRSHVSAVIVGNRVALWVKGNPVAIRPGIAVQGVAAHA